MKEVINQMFKHPIRTTIIISAVASGVASIVYAVRGVKTADKN